jgi:toxin ParE1/3/4
VAQLIWSPRATRDLGDLCEYIAKDSERYAQVIARRVVEVVKRIPDQPLAGGIVPEYNLEILRERFVHRYRVIYRIHAQGVEIVTICHGSRLLGNVLG